MKKSTLFILFICLTLVMLPACQTATPTPGPSQSDEQKVSVDSAAEQSVVKDTSAKPFEGQTLTVLYMTSVYADAARAIVPAFEEKTGATVQVVDFPYVMLHEKALLDFTSGTGAYDVISVACQWDGEFAPFLEELQPYIDRDGFDTNVFIENVFAQAGIWQSKIMGVPHASTPHTTAYRTDLIPNGLPDTWEEYVSLAESLTNASEGFYGISTTGIKEQYSPIWSTILWSKGGAWADEDWNVTINSQEARDALAISAKVYACADPAAPSWGIEESVRAFLDGKAAICEAWPTLGITQDADNPEKSSIAGKWALGVFPYEKTGLTELSGWDLATNKDSKVKDLAWEWIKEYTSADNQNEKFYSEFGVLSPRKAFWESAQIKDAGLYPLRTALETALIWWRIPASVEADNIVGQNVSAFVSGQLSADDALNKMEEGLKTALKSSPPAPGTKNFNR